MRENETRIGGQQWGLFSIFEPAEPKSGRVIDQSVAAWRIASQKTGGSAFENPRSSVQRYSSMVAGGSNSAHLYAFSGFDSAAPIPYNREELLRWHYIPDNELERTIPVIHRRPGYRYPTPEEVAQIQRQFHNPELHRAREAARQEIARRQFYGMRIIRKPDGTFDYVD